MIITIFTDNFDSWFVEYGFTLQNDLVKKGHQVKYVFNKEEILKGDICFLLSCTKLIDQKFLDLNSNNIVIHASDLPKGKGFSPLQWQIFEGKNQIILTLFEVVKDVDSGPYYFKDTLKFDGTELLPELREKMAKKIIDMSINFVVNGKQLKPIEQSGIESFYKRRKIEDDQVDTNKSIKDLFNHLRIADNNKYPLYFYIKNKKYSIRIEEEFKTK